MNDLGVLVNKTLNIILVFETIVIFYLGPKFCFFGFGYRKLKKKLFADIAIKSIPADIRPYLTHFDGGNLS
jgi:hypothetical protein